nr:MAG: bacteriocin class II with double-glycine leader peptide [Bacteriophage sp.]
MKKKNNKKTIPAYAFGMDQLSNYLGGANVFGSAISGLSEEGSTGDVAGSTIGSAASLAGAGLTVGGPIGAAVGGGLGLVSGLIGSIKRKKQMQALRRRKETLNKTKIGMNAAAETEGEYWDDNDLAYTFENGGILPDLAYLDNNEVVRDDYGNIVQVPNTQPGTDNHLVDASTLESVLSDKIKRPGTKNTFAKEGQILSKMTKPSKGKDKFAENTNRLNKINANKAYNKLLAEQEAVKAAKGVKPKVKGIPAYADGKGKKSFLDTPIVELLSDLNFNIFNRENEDISGAEAVVRGVPYGRHESALNQPISKLLSHSNYNKAAARNTAINLGSPTTGTWFAPLQTAAATPQGVDAVTYANDEPISVDTPVQPTITQPVVTNTYTSASNRQVTKIPSTTGSVTTKQTTKPNITKTTTQRLSEPTMPLVNTSMAIDWEDIVTPVNIPTSADEATKKRALGKPKSGYSPDWLSLAPTVYNTLQSLRGPEEEPLVLNPYTGAIRSTMARRRMNIEPARLANSRSRAISNYNLANINANTGANLAARTQAAVDEYASNANMYATKQNADNAYLGEYANTLNNLGQQFVQSENMYNDLNARNRAAARNFGATATSQLGKWSQVNRQMQNQYNRDQMTLPFLADFLSQGFTKEQVDNLLTRTRNRV